MSSAAKVELYISKRPYLKEALSEGIINYSALARKICDEEDLRSVDAVKAALSRYEDHIASDRKERRSQVEEVLKETTTTIKTGVEVEKSNIEGGIVKAKTANGFTSVLEGGDKALISLESPAKLENTPGVIEFILSSLSAEGINVDQLVSCREDTHIIVSGKEAADALDLLQQRI